MRDALFVLFCFFALEHQNASSFFSLGIFLLGASSNFDPTGFQPSREVLNRTSHTERNNSEMRKRRKKEEEKCDGADLTHPDDKRPPKLSK
jgi:hypothetical protein